MLTEQHLIVRDVIRVFPGGSGIHGIDLSVASGQIHAVVGLNGAGKTTLMRLVLGMLQPDAGAIRLFGRDLHELNAQTWARVGHLVDHPLAYPELDVRTNLALAARLHGVPPARIGDIVEGSLVEFDLHRYARVRARALSRGNHQRLGLAGALQHRPDLVVLDEPTSTLDPAGVVLLREVLLHRAADGAGILISSHHLDEVARVADHVTVINRGRVIGPLDPHGIDIERAFFALVHAHDQQVTI